MGKTNNFGILAMTGNVFECQLYIYVYIPVTSKVIHYMGILTRAPGAESERIQQCV